MSPLSLGVALTMVTMGHQPWSPGYYGQCLVSWQHSDHSYDNKHSLRGQGTRGQVANILCCWGLLRCSQLCLRHTPPLCVPGVRMLSPVQLMFVLWHWGRRSPWHLHDSGVQLVVATTEESWQHCHQWNADTSSHQVASSVLTNQSPVRVTSGQSEAGSGSGSESEPGHATLARTMLCVARAQVTSGPWPGLLVYCTMWTMELWTKSIICIIEEDRRCIYFLFLTIWDKMK